VISTKLKNQASS